MILNKKNFFLTLNNNFLFENKPHIAVAVSGGPDSMALAYLMKEWVSVKKGKLLAILSVSLSLAVYGETPHIPQKVL